LNSDGQTRRCDGAASGAVRSATLIFLILLVGALAYPPKRTVANASMSWSEQPQVAIQYNIKWMAVWQSRCLSLDVRYLSIELLGAVVAAATAGGLQYVRQRRGGPAA
jgi:hypothetical protein